MRTEQERINEFREFIGDIVPSWVFDALRVNGFFTAPASTKYHGAYEGGLYDHSVAVARELVNLTDKLGLKWTNPRSPRLIGMFHDLCKIDKYNKSENTDHFDDSTGKWEYSYSYNDKVLIDGHGDKSVMLLSEYFQLTFEEVLCIRYHMGAYEKEEWKQYDLAIRYHNNVLYTHTADMIASKIKGV
jgi:putative nucleotidyltransferase with HDIG domain